MIIFREYSLASNFLMTASVQCTDLNSSPLPVSVQGKVAKAFKSTIN